MHINCSTTAILLLLAVLCAGEEWQMNLSVIDQDGDELISL
jgi:hypothetical protein